MQQNLDVKKIKHWFDPLIFYLQAPQDPSTIKIGLSDLHTLAVTVS